MSTYDVAKLNAATFFKGCSFCSDSPRLDRSLVENTSNHSSVMVIETHVKISRNKKASGTTRTNADHGLLPSDQDMNG